LDEKTSQSLQLKKFSHRIVFLQKRKRQSKFEKIKRMKSIVFKDPKTGPVLQESSIPEVGPGKVLINLKFAGLNHLDLWTWKGGELQQPVISGSDGYGIVEATGEGVDSSWIGKEVIINPSMDWGNDPAVYGESYKILGNPDNGCFAEYVAVPVEYVYQKPAYLSGMEAAGLPMPALTAYRALFTKAGLTRNDKVLITGIGGGAALNLLQMAKALGATVHVTSSSESKIQKAIDLGAEKGYNYKNDSWIDEAKKQGGFDVIIDSAGGNGFAALTEVAKNGARIVLFGKTAGDINGLKPGIIFNKQLRIMGSVMGTPQEFEAMLNFYETNKIRPVIDSVYPLENFAEAAALMASGKQFGKIIFRID
jgi:zinc-binding alcohol dehydrogenase/oxidoreductase